MTNVLVVNSSLNGESGNSNKLTIEFLDNLSKHEQVKSVALDLNNSVLPHLTAQEMQSWMTAPEDRNTEQAELASISDNLIEQIQAADTIVVGMPMYNFGVPSSFKAWIDRIARAGITFRYTENGPEGLLLNKKVYVLAARGGMYAGTPKDTQTQYLKDVFAFLGITEVEFVYSEGLAMGPEAAEKANQQSSEKIIELIAKRAA